MLKLKEKDSMNDLDKSRSDSEQNFVINDSIKLPKLKNKHINLGKIKNNNSLNNEDENNLTFDSNNPYFDSEPISSEDRPKIIKIYKRNKQIDQSSHLNRNKYTNIK